MIVAPSFVMITSPVCAVQRRAARVSARSSHSTPPRPRPGRRALLRPPASPRCHTPSFFTPHPARDVARERTHLGLDHLVHALRAQRGSNGVRDGCAEDAHERHGPRRWDPALLKPHFEPPSRVLRARTRRRARPGGARADGAAADS